MKDNQNAKPTKKKILTYYLILAACILIIAAITVGVVFAVRGNNDNLTLDNGGNTQETPDDDKDNPALNPDDDKDKDKPTVNTATDFISPVASADISQKQDFWHDRTLNMYYLHSGVDFTAEAGTDVLAAVDGTVTEVTSDDLLYGGTITIEHANNVVTVYKFIEPIERLKAGDKVNRGDVIGKVATATGAESEEGSHLHFEVYANDKLSDPEEYLGTEK